MIEIACREVVFHFNKKHLEDPLIPMWVLKSGGATYYVNHVTATIPWSTKETSSNPSTKGSIKFKKCILKIDDENNAELSALSPDDKKRLKQDEKPAGRIIMEGLDYRKIRKYIIDNGIKHSLFKKVYGSCSTTYFVADIMKKEDLTLLTLSYHDDFRILQPNEDYYKLYDEEMNKGKVSLIDKVKSLISSKKEHYGDEGYALYIDDPDEEDNEDTN